jgi:hypothetical protein
MIGDAIVEKTPLQRSRDLLEQLKENGHYSRANLENLSCFWDSAQR